MGEAPVPGDFLFPRRHSLMRENTLMGRAVCHQCGRAQSHATKIRCPDCPPPPVHFASARAAFRYDGSLADAIRVFKYSQRLELGRTLAHAMFMAFVRLENGLQVLVLEDPRLPLQTDRLEQRRVECFAAFRGASGLSVFDILRPRADDLRLLPLPRSRHEGQPKQQQDEVRDLAGHEAGSSLRRVGWLGRGPAREQPSLRVRQPTADSRQPSAVSRHDTGTHAYLLPLPLPSSRRGACGIP